MINSKVGSSVLADAFAAGQEAAKAAAVCGAKVAMVYCSCAYDVNQVVKGVKDALPGVPVLGNTSFTGIVTKDGYIGGDVPFVGVLTLAGDDLTVGIAGTARTDAPCACADGKKIAEAALAAAGKTCPPDALYMAASPAEEEFYLKGISSVIGRVPFFGGSAADNSIAGEWKLYADEDVFADGCIVAMFWGLNIANVFTGAYRETENFGVITKLNGIRCLAEIDGVPAADKYMEWSGVDREAVTGGNLLVTTITSPLGIKDRLGDLIAIRHPMNGNPDGSFNVGANLSEKTCVIRMEATVDELISSVGTTLDELLAKAPEKPAALHLVHCGGRRAGIDSRIGEVAEIVKEKAGDIPVIMEFTFGEYGFVSDSNNTIGGLMLSFTALY